MKAQIIAWTLFNPPQDIPWLPEGYDLPPGHTSQPRLEDQEPATGQDLAEFAGRACYQSWSRPNPATATNRGYLDHIIEVGHESVLEHGTISVYLTGISRSLTHELVRHRHFSYSQLSQRYVDESARTDDLDPIVPPLFSGDSVAQARLAASRAQTLNDYDWLVERAVTVQGAKRKQAREAARSVLQNDTETKIVVTGNYRAWRHFFTMRGSLAADAEIRGLAVMLYGMISKHYSCDNVFRDFMVVYDKGHEYITKG